MHHRSGRMRQCSGRMHRCVGRIQLLSWCAPLAFGLRCMPAPPPSPCAKPPLAPGYGPPHRRSLPQRLTPAGAFRPHPRSQPLCAAACRGSAAARRAAAAGGAAARAPALSGPLGARFVGGNGEPVAVVGLVPLRRAGRLPSGPIRARVRACRGRLLRPPVVRPSHPAAGVLAHALVVPWESPPAGIARLHVFYERLILFFNACCPLLAVTRPGFYLHNLTMRILRIFRQEKI